MSWVVLERFAAVDNPDNIGDMLSIARNLAQVLLYHGRFSWSLFEWDIEDHLQLYLGSKAQDGDDYLLVISADEYQVAMILIDDTDYVHVNEKAREKLQTLWPATYVENIRLMIPPIARQLSEGFLFQAGIQLED